MYSVKNLIEMNVKIAKGKFASKHIISRKRFSNYNLNEKNLDNSHIVSLGKQLNNNFGKTAGVLVEIPLFNKYQTNFCDWKRKRSIFQTCKNLPHSEIENDNEKNTQQLLNDFITAKQQYLLQLESLQQGDLAYGSFRRTL